MKRSYRKKRSTSMLLLILILTVTLGYALLSTTLKINGITTVNSNTWDVRWDKDSVDVTSGSVEASEPSVTESDTKVSFTAELGVPGDYYEFTVDAINAGTVDAMIDNIKTTVKDENNQTTTLPSYILFSVKYNDGAPIQEKHLLAKRTDATHPTKEKYKIRLEFDPEAETLPGTDATYSITYEVKYVQADDTAINRNPYSNAGIGTYYDPVSTAPCNSTTYNQTAVNNGTSTCYKWNIIKTEGNNVTMQLDHNLINSAWADPDEYSTVQQTSSNVINPKVSKLGDINTKAKVEKITRYLYDTDAECLECFNKEGPYTAMAALNTATQNWTRVPLIKNFSHKATLQVASRLNIVEGDFTPLTIQNGVYQAGSNEKTKLTGVRARMITADDVEGMLKAHGHTLSNYQGKDHTANNCYANDNECWLQRDETIFRLSEASEIGWLFDSGRAYWMMTQSYDRDSAWILSGDRIYTYEVTGYETGIRPVITVPKSDIVNDTTEEGWVLTNPGSTGKNQKWEYWRYGHRIETGQAYLPDDSNNMNWYVFSNGNLYYGWTQDYLPNTGEYVHYYQSDFDQDNDGRLDGYRLHDCTMNIGGKNYTFDSNGICTNFDD